MIVIFPLVYILIGEYLFYCQSNTDWSTYGFNLQRTGLNPFETTLTGGNVNRLRRLWKFQMGGTAGHQPVVVLNYNAVSLVTKTSVSRHLVSLQDISSNSISFDAVTSDPTAEPSNEPSTPPFQILPTPPPSIIPSIEPTDFTSWTPSVGETSVPSLEDTSTPSSMETSVPSASPTIFSTYISTVVPTDRPSLSPSDLPATIPTPTTTNIPSTIPSYLPFDWTTNNPSTIPSNLPSVSSTNNPSTISSTNTPSSQRIPSNKPSVTPTRKPSIIPSLQITSLPTKVPTFQSTVRQSNLPSKIPVYRPSTVPSKNPSAYLTRAPTKIPTFYPTLKQYVKPTGIPSVLPTFKTSNVPTKLLSSYHPSMQTSKPTSSAVRLLNLAFVGDERGDIYAININDGSLFWSNNLGNYVRADCFDLPGGMYGIGGTPTFNRTIDTLYVVGGDGKFYALSMKTGAVIWSLLIYDNTLLHSRGGLSLRNEVAYSIFSSHCDFGNYNGKITAVSVTSRKILHEFFPTVNTATTFGAGIWGSGGVSWGDGSLSSSGYSAIGNCKNPNPQNTSYCLKAVRLDPSLKVVATISNHAKATVPDCDFGATVTFFNSETDRTSGCQKSLAVVLRKDGYVFVMDAATMVVIQTLILMKSTSDGQFISSPAWDPDSNMLVIADPADTDLTGDPSTTFVHGAVGLKLLSTCKLQKRWNAQLDVTAPRGNYAYSSPTIVGPVGNRVVFLTTGKFNNVYAISLYTGQVLWKGALDDAAFAAPTIINGVVLVSGRGSTPDGQALYAFGL